MVDVVAGTEAVVAVVVEAEAGVVVFVVEVVVLLEAVVVTVAVEVVVAHVFVAVAEACHTLRTQLPFWS